MRRILITFVPMAFASALAGCAGPNYDHAYFFFSDAAGNGHSRDYIYPTDYTRDYRSYPGDRYTENH